MTTETMNPPTVTARSEHVINRKRLWIYRVVLALTDQGLFSGAGFLLSLLLGRWLAPAQYGAYALAFAVFLFASSFHNSLILEPMGVIGPASYKQHLPAYVAKLVRMHGFVALGLSLLMLVGAGGVFLYSRNGTLAAAMCGASIAVPCVLLSWLLRQSAYLDHRPGLAARGGATYAAVVVLSLSIFYLIRFLNPFTAFLTQAAAGIVAGIVMMALIRPDFDSPVAAVQMPVILAQHWKYGRWVIGTSLVFWVSWQAYYFITANLLGLKEVAALRALQNFVLPLSQFITSLSLLAIPWASGRFTSNDQKAFRRAVFRISLLFTAAGIVYLVFISVFGSWLVGFIYNGKYDQSSALLPVLALSGAFIAAAQGPNIALRAMQAPSDVFVGYSVSAFFTLLTGFALTRHWGLAGAAFGMAASSFCFLITLIWRYRLRLGRLAEIEQGEAVHPGRSQPRVAWLMPSLNRGFYWQPVFKEFAKRFPKSIVFTCFWPGYVPGYEGTFKVRVLSDFKFIILNRSQDGYDRGVLKIPLSVLPELFRFRPQVIFTSGFSVWTLCALILKAFTATRVFILFDGISPSVTRQDQPILLKIRQIMSRFVDGGISNTNEGLEYLRDVLFIPDSKLSQHLYEVPVPEVLCSGDATGVMESFTHPIFLFVGSLIPRKGLDRLIEAADLLVQQGYKSFSLAIVGAGEGAEDLKKQISTRQLAGIVQHLGPIRYENLGAYYKASDVFVFPTLEDVLGLVLLEAMAFGKPVLCSQYAGAREMVQHNVNGFVFDPRRPEELAGYMAKFIENRQMIPEFGARSAEAIAPYTAMKAASAFEALVNRALGSSEQKSILKEEQPLAFD
jgi:glycosyltransferase involved in cell wall biosynthesis